MRKDENELCPKGGGGVKPSRARQSEELEGLHRRAVGAEGKLTL